MASYQHVTFSENLSLSWANPYTGGSVVADINDLSPTEGGLQVMLPFASSVSPGTGFIVNNVSLFAVSMIDVTIEEITLVNPGDVLYFYLVDTSSTAGLWRVIPWGSGVNGMTALTLRSEDGSVPITGGQITPPGGIVNIQLPSPLSSIKSLSVVGIVVANDVDPLTFRSVVLQAGSNIEITDPDGVEGNPLIALNPVLTQLTSLETEGLHIEVSTLAALNNDLTGGNLNLQSSGETGVITLNPVTIDQQGNISGVTNLIVSESFTNPFVPKAWCCFLDNGQSSNNIVLQDSAGVTSVTGSQGSYVITFTHPMSNANYGFSVNIQKTSAPNFAYEAFMQSRNTTSCLVAVKDQLGNLIAAMEGLSVTIWSSQPYGEA